MFITNFLKKRPQSYVFNNRTEQQKALKTFSIIFLLIISGSFVLSSLCFAQGYDLDKPPLQQKLDGKGTDNVADSLQNQKLDGKGNVRVIINKGDITNKDHWNNRDDPERVFDPGAWGVKPKVKTDFHGSGQAEDVPTEEIGREQGIIIGGLDSVKPEVKTGATGVGQKSIIVEGGDTIKDGIQTGGSGNDDAALPTTLNTVGEDAQIQPNPAGGGVITPIAGGRTTGKRQIIDGQEGVPYMEKSGNKPPRKKKSRPNRRPHDVTNEGLKKKFVKDKTSKSGEIGNPPTGPTDADANGNNSPKPTKKGQKPNIKPTSKDKKAPKQSRK